MNVKKYEKKIDTLLFNSLEYYDHSFIEDCKKWLNCEWILGNFDMSIYSYLLNYVDVKAKEIINKM